MPVRMPLRPTAARPRAATTPCLSGLYLLKATVLFGLALALAVSAAQPARAGTYAVTFSGGTYTHAWSDGPLPDFYNGDTVTSDLPWAITDCSGAITATLTWQPSSPTDTPPQNVLVVQTCSTDYWALGVSPPTASASDGLGDPEVDGSDPLYYGLADFQGQSNGTHYSLQQPDANGTVVLSLSGAHADLDFSSGGTVGGGASLAYTVDACPVTLTLQGTTPDSNGNQDILIGQRCNASISGLPTFPAGYTVSYQWSVTGTTFQNWTIAPNSSGQAQGMTTLLSGPGPLTNSTASWYWDEAASSETVACTATVTPPAGQGSPFTVPVQANVNIWEPYFGVQPMQFGRVGYYPDGSSATKATSGSVAPNGDADPGITIPCAVGTPALFSTAGSGVWAWLQLCNLNRVKNDFPADSTDGVQTNGYWLDSAFPFNTDASAGDVPGTPISATINGNSGNAAFVGFIDTPNTPLKFTTYSFSVDDFFHLYMMYMPPDAGAGANWVPLTMMQWGWGGGAQRNGGSAWPDAQPWGTVDFYGHQDIPGYPQWSNVFFSGGP